MSAAADDADRALVTAAGLRRQLEAVCKPANEQNLDRLAAELAAR